MSLLLLQELIIIFLFKLPILGTPSTSTYQDILLILFQCKQFQSKITTNESYDFNIIISSVYILYIISHQPLAHMFLNILLTNFQFLKHSQDNNYGKTYRGYCTSGHFIRLHMKFIKRTFGEFDKIHMK